MEVEHRLTILDREMNRVLGPFRKSLETLPGDHRQWILIERQ